MSKEKLGIDEVLEEWLERESRTYVDAIDAEYAQPDDSPGTEPDDTATESTAAADATPGNQEA